jgi:hypothetical protein
MVQVVKTISSALLVYLNAMRGGDAPLRMGDCFTVTLAAGSIAGIADGMALTYSSLDVPILLNGYYYLANELLVGGLRYKSSRGLSVDTQTLTIAAWPGMTIGGVPFMQALQQGLLDGAEIQRDRCFFSETAWQAGRLNPGTPIAPIGAMLLFKGRVTELTKIGRTRAEIKVASDLTLLDVDMPRNLYTTACQHLLYDAGCGLNRASYTFAGAAGSGSTASQINWTGATANFLQGSIAFVGGANDGVVATIKTASAGVFGLMYPLPETPAAGDRFTAVYGCDHTMATCTSRFSNLIHYRGFPFVPPPEIVTGPLSTTVTGGKG